MLKDEDILRCVEGYILVIDEKGKIIFSNNNFTDELYKKIGVEGSNDIMCFQEKYYSVQTKDIIKENKKYLYICYHDITTIFEYEQSLLKKAMTDSLTRICNRHGIEKAIENFRTSLNSSCVVYADIDHFKNINDIYTHEAGDFILREIAKIISDNIRKDDLVGRMGGEEFLIVLNSTNIEKAKPKLEFIKEEIKKHHFNWHDKQIKVTISFGVSEFEPNRCIDFENTIEEADKALYHSKENGRDQITYFNEMKLGTNGSVKTRK